MSLPMKSTSAALSVTVPEKNITVRVINILRTVHAAALYGRQNATTTNSEQNYVALAFLCTEEDEGRGFSVNSIN